VLVTPRSARHGKPVFLLVGMALPRSSGMSGMLNMPVIATGFHIKARACWSMVFT